MSQASAATVPVRAITFLSLGAFGSSAALRVTDALLPQIATEFAVTTGTAGHVATAFAISYGLVQIVFGPLSERFGKYVVVTAAVLLSGFGALACALAVTLEWLTAARFVSGALCGAAIPISMAWIGDTVPYALRQPVLARFLMGQMFGVVCGQILGGLIGERFGWQAPFYVLTVLYFATGLGLANQLRTNPITRPGPRRAEAAGFVAGVRAVLARPWARTVLFTSSVEGFAIYGPFVFIAAYLHEHFGLSLAAAGGMIALFGGGGILYAVFSRRLVARLRERGLALVAGLCLFLAYLLFALAPAAWVAVPASLLLGLGFYMLHNTLQVNATQMAPEARGVGMALFATCFFTGQSLGVALSAIVVDAFGARPAFLASGALLLALALWFRARLAHRPPVPHA
jgi:MFS transporter, YNFM family, putative membrane transport protein